MPLSYDANGVDSTESKYRISIINFTKDGMGSKEALTKLQLTYSTSMAQANLSDVMFALFRSFV